jgi:hypothetical protein
VRFFVTLTIFDATAGHDARRFCVDIGCFCPILSKSWMAHGLPMKE